MIKIIFEVTIWLCLGMPLLCVSIGLFLWWQKKLDSTKLVLTLFCLNSFIFSFWQLILANYKMNNLYVGNTYILLEIVFLMALYAVNFRHKLSVILTYLLGIASLIVCLVDYTFYKGFYEHHAFPRTFESVCIDILAVLYFYTLTMDKENKNSQKVPMFWANIGILIYFGTNLFLFVTVERLGNYSHELNLIVWSMHAFFLVVMFIFMSVGLLTFPSKNEAKI